MDSTTFNKGDIVRLVSGSCKLTVAQHDAMTGGGVYVVWFTKEWEMRKEWIDADLLERFEDEVS